MGTGASGEQNIGIHSLQNAPFDDYLISSNSDLENCEDEDGKHQYDHFTLSQNVGQLFDPLTFESSLSMLLGLSS